MEYPTLNEILRLAEAVLGRRAEIRDGGLLESAIARPQMTVMGEDAYQGLHAKAAAVLHSFVRNHALVDGNKRLGWAVTQLMYGLNGYTLSSTEDERYDLVMDVATGHVDDVKEIAKRLAGWAIER